MHIFIQSKLSTAGLRCQMPVPQKAAAYGNAQKDEQVISSL